MAFTDVNFQNISGEHALGPSAAFFSSTCFKIILQEKTTLEKMSKFGAPSLKKLLITPQT